MTLKQGIQNKIFQDIPIVRSYSSSVMDFDEQMEVSHFVLTERKCRVCGKVKDLIDGFYLIRKNKSIQSSYSYECKTCTIQRVKSKKKVEIKRWEYPDW